MDRDGGIEAASLRGHRQAAGLTQQELARLAGVSVGVVRDMEQGRTVRLRNESAARLSRALGLDGYRAAQFRALAAHRAGSAVVAHGEGRGSELRLTVLRSLEAWRGGAPVNLGTVRQRAVLALLAVNANAGMHREAIIDALWRHDPPASAVNLVQVWISRLRHILDPGRLPRDPEGLLVSSGTSYRLRLTARQLDLLDFRERADRARAAASSGDAFAASELYEEALGLWRGEPLAELDVLRGHIAVAELAQQRAALVMDYAAAASAAGFQQRVIPHLRTLADREPLNERVHAHLMIALAGCGQQAAALQIYEDLRRRLDDQLGVYPGAELAGAHQAVLRQEVPATPAGARTWVATVRPSAGTGAAVQPPDASRAGRPGHHGQPGRADRAGRGLVVPRQLPAATAHFAGRAGELAALARSLDDAAAAGAVGIAAISGTAGVGKTALAVHWAHQVASRFPDGQLYVNLRGFDPSDEPLTPAEAARGFIDALAVPPERIPASLDAQIGLYRSLLAGRRMLIVLDNARDAAHVRPLLPGTAGCLVVVTSRRRLTSLAAAEGAYLVTLDVLTDAEAGKMLARRLGATRVADEPEAARELTRLCARLPLALAIAAARAADRGGVSIGALTAELRDVTVRLDALDTGESGTSMRSVFSWSYRNLTGPTARIFRVLGVHPGQDISAPAAASLAGIPVMEARRTLRELTRASLLTEPVPGRFAFHDLLRAYAMEQSETGDSEAGRAALCRVIDHYLHTSHAADQLLNPSRDPLQLDKPVPGVFPEEPAGYPQALAWFEAEHHVLLAAASHAAAAGLDRHAWQLPWALESFFDRRGHWRDWHVTQRTALAAARRSGDLIGVACAQRELGAASTQLGDHAGAHSNLSRALSLFRQLGDRVGQARCHELIGLAYESQGCHRQALRHQEEALRLYCEAAHRAGQARARNSIGWDHACLGNYRQALRWCQQALAQTRELGDRLREAVTLDSLGYAHHHLGHHRKAVACYGSALRLYRELGNLRNRATTLTHLGDTYEASGYQEAACGAWKQALDILDGLHHADAGQLRAKVRALRAGTPLPATSADAAPGT